MQIDEHIVADPEICHGKPTFKGTRIMVGDIVELIAAGEKVEDILKEYPGLNRGMIKSALRYAARLIGGERYVTFRISA
ncbi:MAG: antitoxin [Candidatus Aenigmarchaeota archaeon CG_4_10_14_0_8_um_filter_37_24]|nr:DUF433 domain-containing protein [Candidatus Aenigmarchaeota archaeon]OIN87808.1 MAG: antitoxin [Candidatus Aenigmarchaeota archaeon CG1_02_38_14]PIV69378.1 MAG: antitoxin [Candidatus Aenigmarchaeota archaeon CG01_land_8_20_14_3_00_37_9]PIW41779.1 MAG: antitoxin [Candidatus Aenigmarchaeota archaeon CG15_BIG_FIL_POST_REV_8_21_14_020_37_27]PIX50832.1 MAG: antitoxin [Candidatus Aenigmarchaeota archaeon CG_4_8_14_3_um_filter_37_24]PIY35722.1 MAG: antitoxin [Candidatus Aenigmarchaeota archaeon C